MGLKDIIKEQKKEIGHSIGLMKRGPVPKTKTATQQKKLMEKGIFEGPEGRVRQQQVRTRLEKRGFKQPTGKAQGKRKKQEYVIVGGKAYPIGSPKKPTKKAPKKSQPKKIDPWSLF